MQFYMRKSWTSKIWHWTPYDGRSNCGRFYADILSDRKTLTKEEVLSTDFRICMYCRKHIGRYIRGE